MLRSHRLCAWPRRQLEQLGLRHWPARPPQRRGRLHVRRCDVVPLQRARGTITLLQAETICARRRLLLSSQLLTGRDLTLQQACKNVLAVARDDLAARVGQTLHWQRRRAFGGLLRESSSASGGFRFLLRKKRGVEMYAGRRHCLLAKVARRGGAPRGAFFRSLAHMYSLLVMGLGTQLGVIGPEFESHSGGFGRVPVSSRSRARDELLQGWGSRGWSDRGSGSLLDATFGWFEPGRRNSQLVHRMYTPHDACTPEY